MCGIAGLIDGNTEAPSREARVARMCDSMIHRGPDDSGIVSIGAATIGMRRLAIFDPANGHQPMATRDGRYTLVFNGAIYNYASLREELEPLGYAFRTRCDTEVLLAALAHWGKDCLPHLRGMFAFALWDAEEESLLAARDPFGIKPFYYAHDRGTFQFASEIAALVAGHAGSPSVDPRAVAGYLAWFSVPAPQTIYSGVFCLQPGECLTFGKAGLLIQKWWTFDGVKENARQCATREEFVRSLRARLEDSIKAHVLADVPVGAFLSGGLDSAIIAALMARVSGNVLKTFSIGFEEEDFSEADEAEVTAHHIGAVHHTRILTGDEVARDLEGIMASHDQPTGDGINTYYASQTAQAGGVKVALSGLGGDELFGGYPSFRTVPQLGRILPAWLRLPSSARALFLTALEQGGVRSRKLSDFLRSARDTHELAALQRRVFSEKRRRSMLSPDVIAAIEGSTPFHPALESIRSEVGPMDTFSTVSAWELRTYMADVLLRDSDVMSMRHSLELRVPFLDTPFVEWLWRQPSRFRQDRNRPKSVLADATADLLPAGLLRRKKRGFTLPFGIWMRRDLRPFLEDIFSPESIGRSGLFSTQSVRLLWSDFAAGGEDREWSRVWSLAVLISFVNRRPGAQ
jgi:asparagine synthase (glutamine-hydrolysing)